MPSLHDVARHFDDISVYDGYTNAFLFKGQFSNFIENSSDGSTALRRTFSLAPGLAIPARRVIKALSTVSLVGIGTVDGIYDTEIRQSYWCKTSTGLYTLLTPLEAINASVGTVAYGHQLYNRDTANNTAESDYDPFWTIYFNPDEPVVRGSIVKKGSTYHRVRSTHLEADGLTAALADELDANPIVTVTLSGTGVYDPVTDTYPASSTTVQGLLVDRYKWYTRLTASDEKTVQGDMTLVVAGSIAPGSTITLSSRVWTVLTVTAELGTFSMHIRRA